MKKSLFPLCIALLITTYSLAQTPTVGNPATLPFTIEIEDVTQDELSGFHSMAFARWEDWWVLVGGRVGGLHGFFPFTAFPENEANASIWLLNPETGDALNFGVDALNIPYHDPLKATNPQYVQEGENLYICGGYGKESSTGNFITFPVLTAINLPQLVAAMQAHTNPSAAFRQMQSEHLRVCGGEMDKLGDYFYLVGGHDFSGNYTQVPSPMFTQTYTYEIRKFKISNTPTALALSDYSAYHDEQNLRRRDFTLAPLIRPDGSPALCLYGGVFRPDVDLPFYNPVYISENQVFSLDGTYEQLFSQYTCPALPMFDSSDGSMYTLLFAGLSVHYFDSGTQTIRYDEKVPFIRDISTFCRRADGSSIEYVMPQKFDELLGANMIFVPAEDAPQYSNEVLKLHQMTGKTFAGWLFGGIKAEIPNITPSSASNRMFKVFVTPKSMTGTVEAAGSPALLQVAPNPFASGQEIQLHGAQELRSILVFSSNGVLLCQLGNDLEQLSARLESAAPGVYFVQAIGEKGRSICRILKM